MDVYVPLISGFVGALIGALASISTIFIQSKIKDHREKIRMAADIALEDYKLNLDLLSKSGKGAKVVPIVTYLHYHIGLMELLEKNKLTPASLQKLGQKNDEIIKMITQAHNERQQNSK